MTSPVVMHPDVDNVLQRQFGFAELRQGQREVIDNVLAGRDTLAIMPTGSGKSLTYQLSAALLPGVTIVVSPLIALMKDQVDSLPGDLRNRTRLINSTLTTSAMQEALQHLREGRLKLVYVAPERLRDRDFLRALAAADVSLVVIDEAHCISLWGQDFRPDYLFIPKAIESIGQPPVLAVTATATPVMAKQISDGLGRQLATERVSLFRPNLFYQVRHLPNRNAKIEQMIEICRFAQGSSIVYVNSRDDTERFAGLLRDNGVNALHYHAGLDPAARVAAQDRFMGGKTRVIVATIAFGMGVDKANVRSIVHFNPPTSLEAYAQESGRAGRDRERANCILLATPADRTRLRNFVNRDTLTKENLRQVYRGRSRRSTGRWALLSREEIDNLGSESVNSPVALGLLEQAGLVARHADVPKMITLAPIGSDDIGRDGDVARIVRAAGGTGAASPTTVMVADVCNDLGISPVELDQEISRQQSYPAIDGQRAVCIEILPAESRAGARVDDILKTLSDASDRRIEAMIGYSQSSQCRHVVLARQFGERIEPCGQSCDNCLIPGKASGAPTTAESSRTTASVVDVQATLQTVSNLPYPMGKTGLVRYLTGSVESRVRRDKAPNFGILSDTSASMVGRMVDRLVESGLLHRDFEHEYKIISVTEDGRNADRSILQEIASNVGSRRQSSSAPLSLDAGEKLLYDRLVQWRLETAQRDSVPAFVVAHDSMLASVAIGKPKSTNELLQIRGFGPKNTAQYGDEIVALVRAFVNSEMS